jgi:hypothetical protein
MSELDKSDSARGSLEGRPALVQEALEAGALDPHLREVVDARVVRERLGEGDAVDAPRGRARYDVDHEACGDPPVGRRGARYRHEPGDAPVDRLGPVGIDGAEAALVLLRAVVARRGRRAHQVEELPGDAVHVDGERHSTVEHDGEPDLLLGGVHLLPSSGSRDGHAPAAIVVPWGRLSSPPWPCA